MSWLPVATGFPAGQTPLETRLQEVLLAVRDGAAEIDVVINRTLALTGQWAGWFGAQVISCKQNERHINIITW